MRRQVTSAEMLEAVSEATAALSQRIAAAEVAICNRAERRRQLRQVVEAVAKLADRIEKIERQRGSGVSSNGHRPGEWDGVL